jgi:hypothetical protein
MVVRGRRWGRLVGVVATFWNAIGVFNYLAHVGVIGSGGPALGGADMPPTVTACFAVGVFAGLAGAAALAMLSWWARPLLWLSLVGTLIDWIWVFGWSDAGSVPLGITVLLMATLFVFVAELEARNNPVAH